MAVKRKLTKGKEIVYHVEEVFGQLAEEKASLNKPNTFYRRVSQYEKQQQPIS